MPHRSHWTIIQRCHCSITSDPPLSQRRHWDSFHGAWAESIAQHLNQLLPENFVAEARVKLGGQVEINVGTDLGLPIDLEMTYQAACSARRIAY